MTVKMIAAKRHYVKAESKEYDKGESFNAQDDREADILVRRGRAKRAPVEVRGRALKAKSPQAAPTSQQPSQSGADLLSQQGQYTRRDMRAED